jgi:hypothetical protein
MLSPMKRSVHIFTLLYGVFAVVPASLPAETKQIKAEVWDIRGPATFTIEGGSPQPLEPGTIIPEGAVVKTGVGAAVDVSFGRSIGSIRLPQNSVLKAEKLQSDEGKNDSFNIQLALTEGALIGDSREVPETGKFEVKTPSSLIAIRNGKWRIQAEGYVVLLSGTILAVHIPSSGDPALHKLNAPPGVYFSPIEGVRPAPPELIREVQGQLQARLRTP